MADGKSKSTTKTSYVDISRYLDSAILTLCTVVLSCIFLLMFGETLKFISTFEHFQKPVLQRTLSKLFPFKKAFDFNLTHALLFSLCTMLLSLRFVGSRKLDNRK